jgi:hypothetical protein
MKVTLRDLLWLILVCGVALAWFNSDRRRDAEVRSIIDRHYKWQDEWKAETAETVETYRKAALDPVAYREFVYRRNQEVSKARQSRPAPTDE